jgi:hypothetical protein
MDMPNLDPFIVEHHIDTWLDVALFRQKKRPLHPSKVAAIKAEIDNLHVVGFIYPIAYTSLVSNPILINKKKGTIRVCTIIIDDCNNHEALSFMYGFSRYNQIQIHLVDTKSNPNPSSRYKITFTTLGVPFLIASCLLDSKTLVLCYNGP